MAEAVRSSSKVTKMASSSQTVTVELEKVLTEDAKQEAKKALSDQTGVWAGVERVLEWLRTRVLNFFVVEVAKEPFVGRYAARIGTTVTEFIFTVIGTLVGFLKTVFSTASVWKKAHAAAMHAWQANEQNGLLAQTYAYGKKMAGYFLEVMVQCFERAIRAHGLQVTPEEKDEISQLLDKTIK